MAKKTETRRADNFAEQQHDGQEAGNKSLLEADTCSDCTIPSNDLDRLAKALRWLNYARDWRIDNRPAWAAFNAYAESCIAENKTLSSNALHAIIKQKNYVNLRTGKTTALNRTVLPLFARWLLREHPELKVELRKSFFDVLFEEVE